MVIHNRQAANPFKPPPATPKCTIGYCAGPSLSYPPPPRDDFSREEGFIPPPPLDRPPLLPF